MCQFPSWYEKSGEVRFLTDKDVGRLIQDGKIESYADGVGHSAIAKDYNGYDDWDGWEQKELFPCPGPVAASKG